MKMLFVSRLDRAARAVRAITQYVALAKRKGHEAAVFGEPRADFPSVPHSRDIGRYDFVIFVVYDAWDFPDLPHLARLLDAVPRERRVIIDCIGSYNETVKVEHDANHMEKLNGHQAWEWIDGFEAVADKILQPTLTPLRKDVVPFLFFGYDPSLVKRTCSSPQEAAKAWSGQAGLLKQYGVVYVGHNWQRWSQMRRFLEAIEPLDRWLRPICLKGWAWDRRPDWAVEHDFGGVDVDPDFLNRVGAEIGEGIPYDEVVSLQSQARFCPVIHRPLFNRLGLVTNRTFETFCSDTVPVLLLPKAFVETIHGPDALLLAAGDDIPGKLTDMMRRPEVYWDAILKTRAHLAAHHSYEQRFEELMAILDGRDMAYTTPLRAAVSM
jgi:hypothetical protein